LCHFSDSLSLHLPTNGATGSESVSAVAPLDSVTQTLLWEFSREVL
jgi:hypothetical protein